MLVSSPSTSSTTAGEVRTLFSFVNTDFPCLQIRPLVEPIRWMLPPPPSSPHSLKQTNKQTNTDIKTETQTQRVGPARSFPIIPSGTEMMSTSIGSGVWSSSEHERFLEAILLYPRGPWTHITEYVGTRSVRQVQTHARKYQHKLKRHERGLIKRKKRSSRVEHRVDKETATYLARRFIEWPAYRYRHAPFGQERHGLPSSDEDGSASSDEERLVTNSGYTAEALQCLLSETHPATSGSLDEICQSHLDAIISPCHDLEPLPFEASQELDEHELRESLDFLELYGLLDDDRDVNLAELGQCLPGSRRLSPIQNAPCRAAIRTQDEACSLSL